MIAMSCRCIKLNPLDGQQWSFVIQVSVSIYYQWARSACGTICYGILWTDKTTRISSQEGVVPCGVNDPKITLE